MLRFLFIFMMIFSSLGCTNTSSNSVNQRSISNSVKAKNDIPNSKIPDGWKVVAIATKKERECANHSREERKVLLDNETVKISKYEYLPHEQLAKLPESLAEEIKKSREIRPMIRGYLHVEPFENGWLIGSDAGEWGGNLFWISADGIQKQQILTENIRGIGKVGNDFLILTGLAHISIDEGKIYKLRADKTAGILTDLRSQPQNFVIENNDSMIVSLNDKIIRVKTSGEVQKLIDVNFDYLYPNSMILTQAGEIYIGMRMYVVRIKASENGYIQEWLLPQNCQKIGEKGELDCNCQN